LFAVLTVGLAAFKPSSSTRSQGFCREGILKERGRVRDEEGIAPAVGVLAGNRRTDSYEENGYKFVVT
jgi:hypothetical protein